MENKNKNKNEKEKDEFPKGMCITCWVSGHSWEECRNTCVYCKRDHFGQSCSQEPGMYPVSRAALQRKQEETRLRLEEKLRLERAQLAKAELEVEALRHVCELLKGPRGAENVARLAGPGFEEELARHIASGDANEAADQKAKSRHEE
jgi:hypothetical protein